MNTPDRIAAICHAARGFAFLGQTTTADLTDLLTGELGDARALDGFVRLGGALVKSVAPATILHIVSRNTPAAALQSVIRGLLLDAHNLCKIPSAGLPEVAQFRAALPAELAARIEIAPELPDEWLARADALIAFGTDETIAHFRSLAAPHQTFVAHGHALSFGVVFDDPQFDSVAGVA